MRILVTGSAGQLGMTLMSQLMACHKYEIIGYDRERLDITDYEAVLRVLTSFNPEIIINCAAFTNVDQCEVNYSIANNVNHLGAMNIARVANSLNAKLIHISTDFVFNGTKTSPYFEYDGTEPLSVYGKTKLAGEWAVRNECRKHFIVRTSWLYSQYGRNFVKTMIRLGSSKDVVSVVHDQFGSPTNAEDLAMGILKMLHTEAYGTYHFSNNNSCSWCEFAGAIFNEMELNTIPEPMSSDDYRSPAKRPSFSVMDVNLFQDTFKLAIPEWRESLSQFIKTYSNQLRGNL